MFKHIGQPLGNSCFAKQKPIFSKLWPVRPSVCPSVCRSIRLSDKTINMRLFPVISNLQYSTVA